MNRISEQRVMNRISERAPELQPYVLSYQAPTGKR